MLSILNGLLLRTNKTVKQARSVQRAIAPVTVQNLEPRTLMTATWLSGVGDGNWNSPSNWDNGQVPISGQNVVFSAPGNSNFENITLATPVVVGTLTFNGDYNLNGESITLLYLSGLNFNAAFTRFSNELILPVSETAFSVSADSRVDFNGGVSGGSRGIIKSGWGELTIGSAVDADYVEISRGSLTQFGSQINDLFAGSGTVIRGSGSFADMNLGEANLHFDDGDGGTTIMSASGAVEFDSDSSFVTPVGDNGSGGIFAGSLTVSGSGEIQLNDATLTLNGNGTMPTMGGTVTLITNQTGLPIVGTFAGLPEGAIVSVGSFNLSITYVGGVSGRDVVLAYAPVAPVGPSVVSVTDHRFTRGVRVPMDILGENRGGGTESQLTYTWSTTQRPAGARPITFTENGTNGAKNAFARFHKAGTYMMSCTITDENGLSIVRDVTVSVVQRQAGLRLFPHKEWIPVGNNVQFRGYVHDQFNERVRNTGAPTFEVLQGNATFSPTGLFTANARGSFRVQITIGDLVGTLGGRIIRA